MKRVWMSLMALLAAGLWADPGQAVGYWKSISEVKVTDGGKKLAMRGYLGIALLGRTQVWLAADAAEVKTLTGS